MASATTTCSPTHASAWPATSSPRRSTAATSCRATRPASSSGGSSAELFERRVRVAQLRHVDRPARPDHGLDRIDDVPDVDVHSGHYAAVLEPERDELATLRVAAEHDLVPARRVADVLHPDVVL